MTYTHADSPLAIVVAMPEEMVHLENLLLRDGAEREGTVVAGPRRFDRVMYDNLPLVLTTSGMGMVAAAAATEAVITQFAPRAVLNYGCTGAHREDILPGDLVVGTACIAFDRGYLRPGGEFAYQPGRIFREGVDETSDVYPVGDALVALAESVVGRSGWRAEPWPAHAWPDGIPPRTPRVFFGPIASSDRFTQDTDALRALNALHGTLCEDMEAAAIAKICLLHDVPFLPVKDISNNEFHAVSEPASWDAIGGELGKRAASLLYALLGTIAAQQ